MAVSNGLLGEGRGVLARTRSMQRTAALAVVVHMWEQAHFGKVVELFATSRSVASGKCRVRFADEQLTAQFSRGTPLGPKEDPRCYRNEFLLV
ncbi:hypothetical protein Efla_006328 [Eimeria flavescens]